MTCQVLLFGGSGMVGTALQSVLRERGHAVIAPSRQIFDAVHNQNEFPALIGRSTVVVNAATVKDARNTSAHAVNAEFPHFLAEQCNRRDVPFLHLSTDAVFSGASGPFFEDSPIDGATPYGRQKAAGEPVSALVIRFSVVGPEQRGFSALLCWLLAQRNRCDGYTTHLWNGLTSPELARILGQIIEEGFTPGVRHLFSDTVSKRQLLTMAAEAFNRSVSVQEVSSPPRDQRLATRHPKWLARHRPRPLAEQIADLPSWSDERGHWQVRKSQASAKA